MSEAELLDDGQDAVRRSGDTGLTIEVAGDALGADPDARGDIVPGGPRLGWMET